MPSPYETIPKAEDAQSYFDLALSKGRKEAMRVKGIEDRVLLLKAREKERVRAIGDSLSASLKRLHDAYPSFDRMGDFLRTLFELEMDVGRARQALGGIGHAVITSRGLAREHIGMIARARGEDNVMRASRAFLGRLGSLVRQTQKHMLVLNEARTALKGLPAIDESLFTVAIAGFPNVGKSTLLRKLTQAKPEVKPYAFTTKGLNVGYFEHKYNQIQCIDTPGTLNREKPNAIERKADIANRYLASVIVYVFDPTETSYPLDKQLALHETLLELDKPLLVYISKTDVADKEQIRQVRERFPEAIADAEELRKEIVREFRAWV